MSVLVGKDTKLIVQGITGSAGTFHAKQMREYGTNVVGGVTPGKGGLVHEGFTVFDTVADAVAQDGRQRDRHLRAAAGRRRRDPRGRAGRHRRDRLHHRGHPDARHGEGEARARRLPGRDADRPQLPRRDHAGRVQDRHHARLHPQAGQGRRRVALGHADLRGRAPAHDARPRPVDRHRHRRRSGQGHRLRRRASTLFERDPQTTRC